jgi:predicted DNA-binding transcriptional regulator AlpA
MTGEIVSIQRASEITGLKVKTLYNLRSAGQGPASFSLRHRVRYYLSDLEAWIAAEASTGENRRAS